MKQYFTLKTYYFFPRSVLEDPPSISEGCGGRVTDYRIPDFGVLINQNTLYPIKVKNVEEGAEPIQKMKTRLNRLTRYWPLTISSTLIFNLKNVSSARNSFIFFIFIKRYLFVAVFRSAAEPYNKGQNNGRGGLPVQESDL